MKDWIEKLDDFIKMSGSEILKNAGNISHEDAVVKATLEFEKYKEKTKDHLSSVEKDFIDLIKTTEKKLKGKDK